MTQLAREELAIEGLVIDDQHPLARQGRWRGRRFRGLVQVQGQAEVEMAAFPHLAFDLDAPTHELHQATGDGQTQPGATVMTGRRGVGLAEGVEDVGEVLGGNTDAAVAHPKAQGHRAWRAGGDGDVHHHLAALGELDGIARQIEQYLAQAQGIAHQAPGHLLRDVTDELKAALMGPEGQHPQGLGQGLARIKAQMLDGHLAGLDLRKIQDIVDDGHQRVRRGLDHPQIFLTFMIGAGAEGQVGHADDAVHGRADFVAHVGQEQALGAVGLLRGADGGVELRQSLFALGDEAANQVRDAAQVPLVVLDLPLFGRGGRVRGRDRAQITLQQRRGPPQHAHGPGPVVMGLADVFGHGVEAVDQHLDLPRGRHLDAGGQIPPRQARGRLGQPHDRLGDGAGKGKGQTKDGDGRSQHGAQKEFPRRREVFGDEPEGHRVGQAQQGLVGGLSQVVVGDQTLVGAQHLRLAGKSGTQLVLGIKGVRAPFGSKQDATFLGQQPQQPLVEDLDRLEHPDEDVEIEPDHDRPAEGAAVDIEGRQPGQQGGAPVFIQVGAGDLNIAGRHEPFHVAGREQGGGGADLVEQAPAGQDRRLVLQAVGGVGPAPRGSVIAATLLVDHRGDFPTIGIDEVDTGKSRVLLGDMEEIGLQQLGVDQAFFPWSGQVIREGIRRGDLFEGPLGGVTVFLIVTRRQHGQLLRQVFLGPDPRGILDVFIREVKNGSGQDGAHAQEHQQQAMKEGKVEPPAATA